MQTLLIGVNPNSLVETTLNKSFEELTKEGEEDFGLIRQSIDCLDDSIQALTVGEFNDLYEKMEQKVKSR
ncbi:MAG: hypothetical protein HFH45_01820 [Bacilli bacterium]|nr:hypothetical protein [Bacilli bacterium]